MTEQSPTVSKLFAALVAAQASDDRQGESGIIRRLFPPARLSQSSTEYQRLMTKVAFGPSECWLWIGSQHKLGYGLFNGEKAHRASYRLHCGPIPEGLFVLHRCDVRCCVNPGHLFLGTQADNMRDMVEKGRQGNADTRGEANGGSKLTAEQVIEMRAIRAATGESYRLIAMRFGVTTMTAHRAITGRLWGHIPTEGK